MSLSIWQWPSANFGGIYGHLEKKEGHLSVAPSRRWKSHRPGTNGAVTAKQ
jgi:hypothetical protein